MAANGATAISSGELGPQQNLPYHVTSNINDGFYGNEYSWIGGDGDAAPWYAGVLFPSPVLITGVAFGRDNGGLVGDLTDRSDGTYILQYTPDGTQWVSIGTLQYSPDGNDAILGGAFTSYYRHQYAVSTDAAEPILAEGLRIEVSATGIGPGLAIDELEVYGSAVVVPEPSSFWLLGLAGLGLARRRGRSRLACS